MGIIGLKAANCKNCYKCVKVCPVKSIKVEHAQAQIIERNCILCGTCLEQCPQNAKTLNSDVAAVKEMIGKGARVILSVAPSYVGSFDFDDVRKFAGAVKALGFFGVAETSMGAAYVTAEYHRLIKENRMENIITTCCPSANRLIEHYYPSLVDQMAPVVSPMIAHARLLKKIFGYGTRVIFVGPCIAKIDEAADIRHNNDVDAVITFDDLAGWLEEEHVVINDTQPASFLNPSSRILRMYPVTDGIIASLRSMGDTGDWKMLSVSGSAECIDLCKALERGDLRHCFIEINMCKDGCINGPISNRDAASRFSSSMKVRNYAAEDAGEYPNLPEQIPMEMRFVDCSVREDIPDEATIRMILAKIGKESPEDELNCGSCGYPTCRDKAVAVYQNKAELTMCMPYMKERAESLSNCVLTETPNITIIVDKDLNIIEFNTAAEKAFGISRHEALQKCIYEIMDSSDFEYAFDVKQSIPDKKVHFRDYEMTTMQTIVYIAKQNIAMGIYKDITREEAELESKYKLRSETMEMAQKVIDKQMIAAQQIASLLGETTAETKVTLTKLKNMIVFDGDEQ
ncbi:[Fe-Fe] hydrogenase large subunit C-terminal domain-containing protein [Caproiciproducens faecalis]|uniref:4Fe-4S dicluster domain-containing protein n=1 Tax=Caproiciproducens faecalis TaxID=2820301 RepID=A0ABS7DQ55_9FIRM|nr:[Fe-Fe] hydrogenase large subunit C-terminal domain-containing protein [Caproiciproducens faecalis]MBW7573254.1 4Fe-4S dicluster domain-containing protein [Caproiciproducens faecalis]